MDLLARLVGRGGARGASSGGKGSSRHHGNGHQSARVAELERALERSMLQNRQLKQQLEARDVSIGEYLYAYRPVALPLLDNEWDLRYFVLCGQVLKQYKSAKDLVYNPQEEMSVMGCQVEWEGSVGHRWAFSIIDPSGGTRLRLSTMSESVAFKWLSSLEAAGCTRMTMAGVHTRSRSQSGPLSDVLSGTRGTKTTRSSMELRCSASASSSGAAAAVDKPAPGLSASAVLQHGVAHRPSPSQVVLAVGGSGPVADVRIKTPRPSASGRLVDTATGSSPAAVMASSELRSAPGTAGADTGAAAAQRAPGSPPPSHARQMRPDMLASTPVHVSVKFSYLSSERMWHEKHSGLYNLAAVILVAGNIRMALENALKYGLRSGGRMVSFLTFGNPNIPLALCYPIMLLMVLLSLVSELAAYRFLLIERSIYTQLTKQRDLSSADAVASLARRASVAEWLVFLSNIANTTAAIGVPWAVIYNTKAEPAEAIVLILLACILWMKLVSYHHVCWDLRRCRRAAGYAFVEATGAETAGSRRIRTATSGESRAPSRSASGDAVSAASCSLDDRSPSDDATGRTPSGGEGGEGDDAASAYAGLCGYERGTPSTPAEWALLRYPENLTLSNLAYFAAAPTLTYQVNYPRTEKIRLKWLGRRVFELAIVLTAMVLLVNQYIFPAVHNSMRPLQEMDWLHLCERVLRLALPNTYVWLCMFYSLFHLWLNILAELLRFGDREFYKDWWNASTVGEYWRLWNMPVHKWLLRHVYFPSIRLGCSKMVSMVLVFVVSAFFHELLLGVPLHMVRFWAFTGIMLQVSVDAGVRG